MSFDAHASRSGSASASAKIPRKIKRLTAPRCVVCLEAAEVEGMLRAVSDNGDAAAPPSPCRRRRRLRLLPLPPCKCTTVLVDTPTVGDADAPLRGLLRASDALSDADRARMVRRALSRLGTREWNRTPMCLHCVKRMLEAAEEVIEYDYHYADEGGGGGGGGGGVGGGGRSRAQNHRQQQQQQRNPRFTVEPKCPKCKTKFSPRNLHRVVESAEALSLRAEGEEDWGGRGGGSAMMHGGLRCSFAVRELETWFNAIRSTALVVGMVRLERRCRPPPSVPPPVAAVGGTVVHSDSETVTEDDSDEDEQTPGKGARGVKRQMAQPGEIVRELMSRDPKFRQDREDAEYVRSKLRSEAGRAEVIGEGGVLLTEEEIAERRRREDEDARLARELQEADDGGGGGAVGAVDDEHRRQAEEDRRRHEEEDARLARELQEADDGGGGVAAEDARERRRREEEDARLAAREHERMVEEERTRLRKESQYDAWLAKDWQCKLDAAARRGLHAIKPLGKEHSGGSPVDGEFVDKSKAVVAEGGSSVRDHQDDPSLDRVNSQEIDGRIGLHKAHLSKALDAKLPPESGPPMPTDKPDSSSFGGHAKEEDGTTPQSPPNAPNRSHSSSASMIMSPDAEAKGATDKPIESSISSSHAKDEDGTTRLSPPNVPNRSHSSTSASTIMSPDAEAKGVAPHVEVAASRTPLTLPNMRSLPTAKKAGGVRGGGAMFRTLPTRKKEREKQNKKRRLEDECPASTSGTGSSVNAVASSENEHSVAQSKSPRHSPVLSSHAPPSCAPGEESSNGNRAEEPSKSGQPQRRNNAGSPSPRRKNAPTTPRSKRASARRSEADGSEPTDSPVAASAPHEGSSPWARATLGKRAAERERDLSRLMEMGFPRSDVMNCYRDSGEDFDTAIAMLLSAQAHP